MKTFAERCEEAYKESADVAYPFVASIAECQEALEPLVNELMKMPEAEMRTYVTETFNTMGLMPMALHMIKFRLAKG